MSWNDGISKELNSFIEDKLAKIPECAEEAIKETVDIYAQRFYQNVKITTPRRTDYSTNINTDLYNKIVKEKITNRGNKYYGYRIYFEGEFRNGNYNMPYEKLANILNYGSNTRQLKKDGTYGNTYQNVVATRFISKEIKKLKGIEKSINDTFLQKEREVMNNGN